VGGNATFHQQFQVFDSYFKPGGPIIFIQGTENANWNCLEVLSGPASAKELGALLVGLEHRYFGISVPNGLNYTERATWPVALLKPLTLDNVLLDAVAFVDWIKRKYNCENCKVISISGELVDRIGFPALHSPSQVLTVEHCLRLHVSNSRRPFSVL
jgi:dipeptidyl-peptidase-2